MIPGAKKKRATEKFVIDVVPMASNKVRERKLRSSFKHFIAVV
jgi:hypothetical protein